MPGHRGDHVGVEISSKGETLLHVSDSLKHPIQAAYPDFYGEFDTYPEIIIATNKKILKQAAEKNAILFMAHYTFPGLVRVQAKDNAWDMKPIKN
jgi:glyoxylase-like metal-dependent hydrolase (beta-lactamase superfamily II)